MKRTTRKLIGASGMLLLSLFMLSTATYAWFTMSKEVEVTGLNITAQVPETIELSLGLGQGDGELIAINQAKTNGVELVQAPANTNASTDWSNIVEFNNFYKVPKLTPASSNTGANIWTTEDATGIGKTVNENGVSIAATKGVMELIDTPTIEPINNTTTAHYIDYPIWFRTTQTSDVTLSVRAKVVDGDYVNQENESLYKAARVSILKGQNRTSDGVIIPFADSTAQDGTKYFVANKALASANTLGTQGSGAAYGTVSIVKQNTDEKMINNPDGDAIITIPGKNSTITNYTGNCTNQSETYGDAVCVIVRVWLEGEDKDCYNATAGQDFNLSLEFTKIN